MLTSQDIEFFVSLAQSKSLAATARKLNVTPPSVSQRLQALEQKLNVTLVKRGSRATSLTVEGEILLQKGLAVLQQIVLLEDNIIEEKQAISGKLRIVAPIGYGAERVAPLVAEFKQMYPLTQVELMLSDTPSWSHRDPPDILIYIGQLKDSSLTRIVLSKNQRLLLASPSYLQHQAAINCPTDLINHKCIALQENNDDVTLWKFTHKKTGALKSIRIAAALTCNLGSVVKEWAINGHGIIQRSQWNVVNELKNNKLQVILPEYALPTADIVALVSSNRNSRPAKVNCFIDFLKAHLAEKS
ncbi:LysR family transcriptional regulator [Pseudoalteromonas mariniglutinosa]|uniref:LysR family transcriptional regulator n=1 Tax=Pseudoalteromonas mariniglutinosa TaxID=206042 RepID=UPI00384A6CC3